MIIFGYNQSESRGSYSHKFSARRKKDAMEQGPNNKAKRIIGLILLILSVIFFLVSLAGLIGIWVYNQPLTERALTTIETTSDDLEGAALAIELSKAELISARAQIDLLQAILETLGVNAAEDLNRLADIVGKVEDTLTPVLDSFASGISTLRDSLLAIKDTLERINELPLVNIQVPGIEAIEEGANQLENLQNQIEEGGGKIEQLSQTTQNTVDSLSTGFAELETSIEILLETLNVYEEKIESTQEQLQYLESNLPTWIDLASITLTVILVWLGISQVGVFILAWSLFKEQDLIAGIR
jgi:methyl-accepting chemotaxis protein